MATKHYYYIDLPLQLALKTEKQIIKMMKTRAKREIEAFDYIERFDKYPFYDLPKYQTKIKKCDAVLDDVLYWMDSASYGFSAKLWDKLVGEAFGCLDCYGSHNMEAFNKE